MPPEDIEMSMQSSNGHSNGNGYHHMSAQSAQPRKEDDNVHYEDEDSGGEEDDEALLGSPAPMQRHGDPQGLWAQVKGIVLESAPTLLLTTIGLLFTGELLDSVSVSL